MKILHLCLSCFYIDNAGYQENHLVREHVDAGHDVLVIASTETFDGKGGLGYKEPGNYMGSDGARVIRLPYARWLPHKIARKLRIHSGLYSLINGFNPDSILFHGCAGNEIVTTARYASDHPDVLFYADSHEDLNNSARNFVSKNVLHRLYYRNRLRNALPHIQKILCVNVESMEFVSEIYGIPKHRLEFFPIGGKILEEDETFDRRAKTRGRYELPAEAFVFLQSGKMTVRKKLAESLDAFSRLEGDHLRFWITGLLTEDTKQDISGRIEADARVSFLGWKCPDELNDLLCAADAYIQPGTQSVTMQNALCCGCPVIIDDVPGHRPYTRAGATLVGNKASLTDAMQEALRWNRDEKRALALRFAKTTLDYRRLAARILSS